MDYIIFGIGSGATLVLAGWLLRDWGPRLRDRAPAGEDVLSASELVQRMAWARFCASCGMALILCGIPILIVTVVATALDASDERGALSVLIAFGVAVLLMLVWLGLYLSQFGSVGIRRPRVKVPKPKEVNAPKPTKAPAPTVATVAAATTDVAASAPDSSFSDAAAAPGGLGRFAAFLRKDAEPTTPEPELPTATEAPEAVDELAATDAVIAALAGDVDAETEKRLDHADPLVTAVLGDEADDLSEHAPATGTDASPVEEAGDDAGGDVTADTAVDAALDTLRRRRIERLARSAPPE